MQQTRIIFRADGNSQIGLGHVVRSLALADMLKNDFECLFAIQAPTAALVQQLSQICTDIILLPEKTAFQKEAEFLVNNHLRPGNIVVLDGYNFDTKYQKCLKQKGNKLVCIDDVHAFHFVADLVINHAPGIKPDVYDAEPYTEFCLGPEFALLRKPFLQPGSARKNGSLATAFICFGGADPQNLTLTCLKAVARHPEIKTVHVVLGSSYLFRELLQQEIEGINSCRVTIHQNLNATEMKAVMEICQLAICPASSILMETLSCNLKAITGYYVENQRVFSAYCHENSYCLSIGNFLTNNSAALEMQLIELVSALKAFEPKPYIVGNPAENLRKQFIKLSTSL